MIIAIFLFCYLQLKRLKRIHSINIFLWRLFTVGPPAVFICSSLDGRLPLNWHGARMYNTLARTHSSPKASARISHTHTVFLKRHLFFYVSISFCVAFTHTFPLPGVGGPFTGRRGGHSIQPMTGQHKDKLRKEGGSPYLVVFAHAHTQTHLRTHTEYRSWQACRAPRGLGEKIQHTRGGSFVFWTA